jgi:autotransporter-associated beta strand protein
LTKVVKTGTGTWNLGSSVSDYSGGTELRQGTIVITGSSDSFGSGDFQMYDGTTLTASGTTVRTNKNNNNFQLGGNLTMSWLEFSNTTLTNNTTISVVGTNSTRGSSMTFAGSGIAETGGSRSLTLNAGQGAAETNTWSTFSGANSFSGGLTLGSGMSVRLTNNGTLGATNGAVNLANGSINLGGLTRTNGALTVSTGTISNGTIFASSVALTSAGSISAVLAGSGALTKSGSGTSVLSGANTYSGGTTISAGTLQGDTTSLRGAITNNANLLFDQSTDGEYSGVLSGSGALTVDGNSTAVVTVSGNNSFSGLTSFTNGTLRLGSATALGSGGSDWTTTGTRLGTGAILDLNGKNVDNEALGMNSSTAYVTNSSTTTAIWGGSISLTNGTNQFNVASGKDITLNGSIVYGTASRQIMKNGDGVLTVAGSANTNSGAININAGTFRMGHATALGANSTANDVTVASGATLDLNGYTATASIKPIKLSGTGVGANGALQNSASDTTATVNNAVVLNANSSAGGAGNITMAGSVSGASTLTKVGTGTLALGSGASASVSTIAIQQGTLLLGAANQIGNDTGITMSGGTLGMGGFNDTAGKLSVSADSIFDFGNTGAGTSTFTFNDFDTATYGGVAGLTLQNVNIGSQIVFNTNYSGNSTFNTFTTKISFSDTQLMNQISFSGGTTTLTVAAIPEPKVYVAAGALALLIGYAEVRRRRKSFSSKA